MGFHWMEAGLCGKEGGVCGIEGGVNVMEGAGDVKGLKVYLVKTCRNVAYEV